MNRAELVENVAKATGQPKSEVTRTLSAFIHTITSALAKGDKVTLVGFGTFERRQRKARTGRNPRTLAPLKIAAAKVPAFRAGKELKDIVNGRRSNQHWCWQSRKPWPNLLRKLLPSQSRKQLLSRLRKPPLRKAAREGNSSSIHKGSHSPIGLGKVRSFQHWKTRAHLGPRFCFPYFADQSLWLKNMYPRDSSELASAFPPSVIQLGEWLARDQPFYQVCSRYIVSVSINIQQVAIAREHVHERAVERLRLRAESGKPAQLTIAILWCALCLAFDRYFAEKAEAYGWAIDEHDSLKSGWMDLMYPLFTPSNTTQKISAGQVQEWSQKFFRAHRRDFGPYASCSLCTSKCQYSYEVSRIVNEPLSLKVNAQLKDEPDLSPSELITALTTDLIGSVDTDLAYCLAVHLISDGNTSSLAASRSLQSIRSDLEKAGHYQSPVASSDETRAQGFLESFSAYVRAQIFEQVVMEAISGNDWKERSAQLMRRHWISQEDVEQEVARRLKKKRQADSKDSKE